MREIKFRGKKIDNGEWIYGYYAKRNGEVFILTETVSTHCKPYFTEYKVMPETVGQFTGLTDKNGKEIYEGDILKSFDYVTDKVWGKGTNGEIHSLKCIDVNVVVKWHESNARFIMSTSSIVPCSFALEVIGNIYENTELLEVNQ